METSSFTTLKPITKQKNLNNMPKETRQSKKFAHFDEQNLNETYHPENKDYGFMSIGESKTPFPRNEAPVDPEYLREKLLAINTALSKKNSQEEAEGEESSSNTESDFSFFQESFETKRKKFYASEFLIAKQRLLSNELHTPGDPVDQEFFRLSDINSNLWLHRTKNSIW